MAAWGRCMPFRVCFAYPWATYGGVERVLLNRAYAFMAKGLDVDIDVYYAADGGGMASFQRTIRELGLDSRMRVVPTLVESAYDAIFVIDAPDMLPKQFGARAKWVVECHTPYRENREYLSRLPEGVQHVLVPSSTFADTLQAERPELAAKITLLRNCVSPAYAGDFPRLPAWAQRPLLYFGRLDELKNPQEFLDVLAELERRAPNHYFGVVVGPEVPGYGMERRIDAAGLRGRVVQMPPLAFTRTALFLASWCRAGGIMLSPSRGETFGLAVAESIAAGIPVVLSHLPEHSELISADAGHLYPLGDIVAAAEKVIAIDTDYEAASERMYAHARRFSDDAFVSDWVRLLVELGLEVAGSSKFEEIAL
ncbi:glycosyltransferase family 4 protein [Pseudoxanthomonas suwonensis]|nr:glycosyltransferase family 4 protein [Pseudoxanthomonas suwonensis]